MQRKFLILPLAWITLGAAVADDSLEFTNVTRAVGIESSGKSYGLSWGDGNGDTWPDLWISNHGKARYYENSRNGTFQELTSKSFGIHPSDKHAGAWGDFDNDGDQDFIELVGGGMGVGRGPNRFFVNEGGRFIEQADRYGLAYELGRSRTPLWWDFDGDRDLDLLITALSRPTGKAPPALFENRGSEFRIAPKELAFSPADLQEFCTTFEIGDGASAELACLGRKRVHLYRMEGLKPEKLPPVWDEAKVNDFVFADLNGDLLLDLYLARGDNSVSEVGVEAERGVNAKLELKADWQGFSFQARGPITIELANPFYASRRDRMTGMDVLVGPSGENAGGLRFGLDPESSAHPQQMAGLMAERDRGVFFSHDPEDSTWQVVAKSPFREPVIIRIQAASPIRSLEAIGFAAPIDPVPDVMMFNVGGAFGKPITIPGSSSRSVVAGDFDSDGDLDLYLVASGTALNHPNRILRNNGQGSLKPLIPGAAAGTSKGIGDSAATADFDGDGFLDIAVTNGSGMPTVRALTKGAPVELFRGQPTKNRWLKISLQGTRSNRDGRGSLVYVTAGGRQQVRFADGGMHKFSQNDSTLHFGLAQNTTVEEIRVLWPSGADQIISSIPSNQLISIQEPDQASLAGQWKVIR